MLCLDVVQPVLWFAFAFPVHASLYFLIFPCARGFDMTQVMQQ
jgi:hypothetical protein